MPSGKHLLKNVNRSARINGVMQLIEEVEITGAAVTDFDFASVLDGDVDGGYRIEAYIFNPGTTDPGYTVRANAAVMVFATSGLYQTGASTLAGFYNASAVNRAMQLDADPAVQGIFITDIPITRSNAARFARNVTSHFTASANRVERGDIEKKISTPSDAANIVSLGVEGSQAGSIGISSIFRLWRLNNAN